MIKRRLQRWLPSHDRFRQSRWLRWLNPWLGHPRLWHMHRRSVASGVAIGLVTGLLPGPVQMLTAAIIAIPLRANIPAALFATLYSNPLTFVPLYLLAFQIGLWVTGKEGVATTIPPFEYESIGSAMPDFFRWMWSLGDTLLIGLAVQAAATAGLAYLLVMIAWRAVVTYTWRRRHAR